MQFPTFPEFSGKLCLQVPAENWTPSSRALTLVSLVLLHIIWSFYDYFPHEVAMVKKLPIGDVSSQQVKREKAYSLDYW